MARMDNGADYEIFKHEITNKPERSNFNLSYLHTFTQKFGELRPFYLEETVPGDKFIISNDILCRVQAMEVPIMSNIRIYTHYYYNRMSDLWDNWENFCTRGRSGNYETTTLTGLLQANETWQIKKNGKFYGIHTPDSLANALGLPIAQKYGISGIDKPSTTSNIQTTLKAGTKCHYSMLPFFMYQKLYRDYYMNQNVNENDKLWFPDDERKFILGTYDQQSWKHFNLLPTVPEEKYDEEMKVEDDTVTFTGEHNLYMMRFRNWRDDYFTSAMPWPQRGSEPFIEAKGDAIKIPKDYVNITTDNGQGTHTLNQKAQVKYDPYTSTDKFTLIGENYDPAAYLSNLYVQEKTLDTPMSVKLTMESLRKLTTMQLWQERNARVRNTGNYYNNMIYTHFGSNPKANDRTAIFIGGTVQDISVSEILQTTPTIEGSQDGNALGKAAGHGISANSGYVCEFNCPDYGFIMGIMSIVPDVTYSEGVDRMWSRETFADIYYPEFNGLGPQAILKKEIKAEGPLEENDDLWAYQERNSEYKHRRNRISGEIANKNDKYYSAFTMARFFESRPEFNQNFVTTENNISMRSFTFEEEDPFVIQVANIVKATRPMPYLSQPKGLI